MFVDVKHHGKQDTCPRLHQSKRALYDELPRFNPSGSPRFPAESGAFLENVQCVDVVDSVLDSNKTDGDLDDAGYSPPFEACLLASAAGGLISWTDKIYCLRLQGDCLCQNLYLHDSLFSIGGCYDRVQSFGVGEPVGSVWSNHSTITAVWHDLLKKKLQPLLQDEQEQMVEVTAALERADRLVRNLSPRDFGELDTPVQKEKFPMASVAKDFAKSSGARKAVQKIDEEIDEEERERKQYGVSHIDRYRQVEGKVLSLAS